MDFLHLNFSIGSQMFCGLLLFVFLLVSTRVLEKLEVMLFSDIFSHKMALHKSKLNPQRLTCFANGQEPQF